MRVRIIGAIALLALGLVGCTSATPAPRVTPVHFRACQLSEKGDTQSQADSEQITYGLQKAKIANGIHLLRSAVVADSTTTSAVFDSLVRKNCSLVVTSGKILAKLASEAAAKNPTTKFLSVTYDESLDEASAVYANFKTVRFDVTGVAFLAGYAAASVSETGKVGIIGATKNARVSQYVAGFDAGVVHFNEVQRAVVQVLNGDSAKSIYVGDDPERVRLAAAKLASMGADVLMLPAGAASSGAGSVAAMQKTKLVFCDSDWWFDPAAADFKSQILTSAMVNLIDLVYADTVLALAGDFASLPSTFEADLTNQSTALAANHDISFSVALANELDQLTKDIISGEVTIP